MNGTRYKHSMVRPSVHDLRLKPQIIPGFAEQIGYLSIATVHLAKQQRLQFFEDILHAAQDKRFSPLNIYLHKIRSRVLLLTHKVINRRHRNLN